MIHTSMSRGRSVAALGAALGLFLGAAAVVPGPARSAGPAGDCTQTFPESELAKDQAVTTLSVVQGTEPVEFSGKVLGIAYDQIAFGVDMIMVEITPPPAQEKIGGIWQGMSGSPVYAEDGRLIGAISYGLSNGPSWIAGVTPFDDMDDYLAAPAAKVAVSDRTARTIAQRSDVTAEQASGGFTRLRIPIGVSGVNGLTDRLAQIKDSGTHAWLPRNTFAMGSAAAPGVGPGAESIKAGGNLAASLSYGDVTQAGVGTATSVCQGRVVGFGHPMAFLGSTTLALHPADAIYIQPDSAGAPFKMANLSAPAGTITDDHLTGITGVIDAARLPQTTHITSTVRYADRTPRTGESHVTVPRANAATTFYELVGNHDRVVDGVVAGSELLTWTIEGHQDDGSTVSLQVTDRYASDYDISFDSAFELADFVWSLSAIRGVTIDQISTASDVIDDNSTWTVSALQHKVAGQWTNLVRGEPLLARAGSRLELRALLTGPAGTRSVPIAQWIPRSAAGGLGRLSVTGGGLVFSRDAYPRSVAQAERYAANLVRNDQLQVQLEALTERGPLVRSHRSRAQDRVVYGRKAVRVFIR